MVLRAARDGAAEGFCCLALEQTAGRGRQGRAWVAPPGSALLASVLLRRSIRVAPSVPFAAGLALVDALSSTSGLAAGLKWPNDVQVGGRKLAGILSEVDPSASTGGRVAIALGIGLNLRVDHFPDGLRAVSLHTVAGTVPSADAVLMAWGDALGVRIAQVELGGVAALLGDWRRHAVGLGESVTVHGPSGTLSGIAVDVAEDGALVIDVQGEPHRVLAGEVHLTRDGLP